MTNVHLNTTVIDHGARKLRAKLRKAKAIELDTGIFKESMTPDGQSISEYAAANEFGARMRNGGDIPERSFMRSTMRENMEKYRSMEVQLLGQYLLGNRTLESVYNTLGEEIAGDIVEKIVDLRTPPNAPATILKKNSSNPLVDKGHMRKAVRHKLKTLLF